MKKQIFIITLSLISEISAFGQSFKLDATGTNDVRLRTNNIDRLNISAGGNVGIGTATPASKFHLFNGSSGLVPIPNMLATLESNTSNYLSFLNGGSGDGGIIFGSSGTVGGLAGHAAGFMTYGGNQRMKFGTGFTSRMTISNSGNVGIGIDDADASVRLHVLDANLGGFGRIMKLQTNSNVEMSLMSSSVGLSAINFGTSTDEDQAKILYSPSSYNMALRLGTTDKININATGVGIGIFSPESKLHVYNGSAGNITPFHSSVATFEGSAATSISILSPANNFGTIFFGSPTSNVNGQIVYEHPANRMRFGTASGTKMTIEGNGYVGIGTTPTAKLEVAGNYAISGKTPMTGSQNNFNLGGKSVLHVSGGGSYTLTGIANGTDGMILHIYVSTSTDLILADNSVLSLAVNRIVTGSNADITISQGGGATLIYDADVDYWRVIGLKL